MGNYFTEDFQNRLCVELSTCGQLFCVDTRTFHCRLLKYTFFATFNWRSICNYFTVDRRKQFFLATHCEIFNYFAANYRDYEISQLITNAWLFLRLAVEMHNYFQADPKIIKSKKYMIILWMITKICNFFYQWIIEIWITFLIKNLDSLVLLIPRNSQQKYVIF